MDHTASILRESSCALQWRSFSELPGAWAGYFPNTDAYDFYQGKSLLRSPLSTKYAGPTYTLSTTINATERARLLPEGELQVGECTSETTNGAWHTQRVGPFRSSGGYDWWQLAWRDVFALGGQLQNLPADETLAITGLFSGPIDVNGSPIGLPPIHVHHMHLAPRNLTIFESDLSACLLFARDCVVTPEYIVHVGDHEWSCATGGKCFGSDYGDYAKTFDTPLNIWAEFNDARPAGSPPLEWWYQISIHTKVYSTKRPPRVVSGVVTFNPIAFDPSRATYTLQTFWLPPATDSFIYYTLRMPLGGTLVPRLTEFHAHMTAFQEAYMFAASPAELGLGPDSPRLWPDRADHPITARSAGFASNAALRDHLLGATTKDWVCRAVGRLEEVGGVWYDRAAELTCLPWNFSAGSIITVIGFNGPTEATVGKQMAAMAKATEAGFPQHVVFFLWVSVAKSHTELVSVVGSQTVDSSAPFYDRDLLLRGVLRGHTPQYPASTGEQAGLTMLVLALWLGAVVPPPLIGFAFLVLFCTGPCLFVRRLRTLRCAGGWQRVACHYVLITWLAAMVAVYALAVVVKGTLPDVCVFSVTTAADCKELNEDWRLRDPTRASLFEKLWAPITVVLIVVAVAMWRAVQVHEGAGRAVTSSSKSSRSAWCLGNPSFPMI